MKLAITLFKIFCTNYAEMYWEETQYYTIKMITYYISENKSIKHNIPALKAKWTKIIIRLQLNKRQIKNTKMTITMCPTKS